MDSSVETRALSATSFQLGDLALSHRLFVTRWSPLTDPHARLGRRGGLLITEPLAVGAEPDSNSRLPGLQTSEQVNRWREVTCAINQRGAFLCAQLTLPAMPLPAGQCAPSDSELLRCFEAFRDAAENAIDAGFDGVELAAGPGTVGGQLLGIHTSLAGELLQVLQDVWGNRCCVGMQLGPGLTPPAPFELGEQLRGGLSWIHVAPCSAAAAQTVAPAWRQRWKGALLVSGGFDTEGAQAVLASGVANLVGVEAAAQE